MASNGLLAQRSARVVVIGAGAAGLAAARELLKEGHKVRVFEQSAHIGGVWDYSAEVDDDLLGAKAERHRVHGSMYAQLRTNLPRQIMGFTDFPFDTDFPGSRDSREFPSHDEVLRYLEAYAAAFDLASVVQTNTQVIAVRPIADGSPGAAAGQWEVTTRLSNGVDITELYDAVVVCNGHYSEPRLPSFPGMDVFPGLQMHSHNYRTPDAFKGKTVVVLGASASGLDIAKELANVGARVYLCARVWENLCTGEPLNMPTSDEPAKPGEVVKCANIHGLHDDGSVLLESGVSVPHVDAIIYCTGFYYYFPFLEDTGIVTVDDNRVGPLYQHVFPPSRAPDLSFVGLPWKTAPMPQFQLQSTWIARALSGRVQLPSAKAMEEDVVRFYAVLAGMGVPKRFTHRQAGDVQWLYNNWLVEACGPGVPRWPTWRVKMYEATGKNMIQHPDSYRDQPLPDCEQWKAEAHQEALLLRRTNQSRQ